MKDNFSEKTFSEILKDLDFENESTNMSSPEISSVLEPAFLSTLVSEVSHVRVQFHSVSQCSYSTEKVRKTTFKLKSQGMSEAQFAAYEKLLYALELPIIAAHKHLPETFTLTQLKKSYKLAALKTHPDRGGCHESFLEIKKCYDILEGFVKTKAA